MKQIILVCSPLVRPQLECYVCVLHDSTEMQTNIGGTEQMDRFSLGGFPRPHPSLHFSEIVAESFILCLPNVLCILYFYNFTIFTKTAWFKSPFFHCRCMNPEGLIQQKSVLSFNTDFTRPGFSLKCLSKCNTFSVLFYLVFLLLHLW